LERAVRAGGFLRGPRWLPRGVMLRVGKSATTDAHERVKDFLDESEIDRLLAAARSGRHGVRDHLLMLMMYRHGLRVSEAIGLRREHVNLQRLGHAHPHMLRHSCGYALADLGTDFRVLQDFLGHRDPSMTVRYTRIAGRRFEGLWR
jgi:type 1 fimbriae regulatory protein FimB